MTTQTETQEMAARALERANRYDLTELLHTVFFEYSPDELRRDLMSCYFYIADRELYPDEEIVGGMYYKIHSLRMLIEALDNTPEEAGTLKVVPAEEAAADTRVINELRADVIETHRRERTASIEAAYWADCLSELRMMVQLSEEQQEKYRAFVMRMGETVKKKKADIEKLTVDNLEQLEREREHTEAEMWREIYRALYQRAEQQLSPEQRSAHRDVKDRIERVTKRVAILPTEHPII